MKKIILAAILPLFAIWGCDNTTIVDHAYEGTINQNTNVTGPSVDEAVDLGLSVKWAPYNIGATKPSDFGNYYAYGETEPKENYSSGNYTAPANKNTFGNIISTQSDAATAEWGANWRMPSKEEIEELKQCRWETIEDNGVKGVKITGKNGNSIFLPAAGIITESKLFEHNSKGFYRSGDNQSSKLEYFNIPEEKFYGCCIRPVLAIAGEQAKEISIPQESEAIDLGLSVKWAPYNIGASEAWEYGNYYAFGEIEPKNLYLKNNYVKPVEFNCEGSIETSNSDISTVKWGKQWRMPSASEYNELFELCEVKLITIKDNMVFEITGPNGNKLHLPLNGYCDDYKIFDKGISGGTYYWNSNYSGEDDVAYRGFAVRPVLNEPFKQNEDFPVPTKEESVNLGLSVNWAPYNVGASSSTENGNYYAWGEIEYKDYYCEHNYTAPAELNADGGISGTQYDVAHMKWGNGWRMPTAEEIKELWDNCIWSEESIDGVKGIRITAINGNSIFLPSGGNFDYKSIYDINKTGYYRYGNKEGMNLKNFNLENEITGALVRPVIAVDKDDNEETTNDIIDVTIENESNRGYRREWWYGVFEHEVIMDFNLRIELKDEYAVNNLTDYGVILYKDNDEIARLSYTDNNNYSFPASYIANRTNRRDEYVTIDNTTSIHVSIPKVEGTIVSNTASGPRLSIKAIDKDFFISYVDSLYYATLGKTYKYKAYYKKMDSNGNEIMIEGDMLHPLDVQYRRQPNVYLTYFGSTVGDEVNGRHSLHYEYTICRNGSLFLDTLYSVNSFFIKENGNGRKLMKKEYLSSQLLADGNIGYGYNTSYGKNDYIEYDYRLFYIEGILRKGNYKDTLRTNPIIFDLKSQSKWVLTLHEEWPNEFKFWENN